MRIILIGTCLLSFGVSLQADVNIVIETEKGVMEAVLYDTKAPVTVANFLKYVDAKRYDGGRFHRTVRTKPDNQPQSAVKIDVIQASAVEVPGAKDQPIQLERTRDTALHHVDGALSMARSEPDSATSDFFICIGPQPELDFGGKRNPDGQGFAVFGKVTKGMDAAKGIHESPSGPSAEQNAFQAGNQSLAPPVTIVRVYRRKG
jgi:peptidyl-prolyl cis-trans isomerase A (cyclophilin A)